MSKDNFFKSVIKQMDDEFTKLASEGSSSSAFEGYIDTGSYILNAILSGSLFGGWPDNKVLCIAGESTTGKTFFLMGIAKSFLDANPTAGVIDFDTEAAHQGMLKSRGLDEERVVISEPETLEQFQDKALQWYNSYLKCPEKSRPKMMFLLDSLGELATAKELADAEKSSLKDDGNQAGDMGKRSQIIKRIFRVLRARMAKLHIPMILTNHTYEGPNPMPGLPPVKKMNGGKGVYYSSDTILWLTKSKFKDGDEIAGSVVKVRTHKSRFTKQDKEVEVLIHYDKGLDRYYGVLDYFVKYGIVKKMSKKYQFPNGKEYFETVVNRNPDKFFTQEMLAELEPFINQEFKYGGNVVTENDDEIDDESIE